MNRLSIEDLSKRVSNKIILENIDLTIDSESIVALIGKNGAGKTSLIKSILGLYTYDTGIVNFYCDNRKIIYDTPPNLNITVKEYLNLFSMIYRKKSLETDKLNEILNMVSLEEYQNKKIKMLSYGMKKKLYLSTILLGRCDIIILDEPFNGLDYEAIIQLKSILTKCKNEYKSTIIISSHLLGELYDVCDSICILEHGRVMQYSSLNNNKKYLTISCEQDIVIKRLGDFFSNRPDTVVYSLKTKSISIEVDEKSKNHDLILELIEKNLPFEEIYYNNPIKEMMKRVNKWVEY